MTDFSNPEDDEALYSRRQKIYPKAVKGFFRRMKWRIMVVTLAIYYLTPWIRWYRGEGQPDQAVLIDMANRRFYFFFIEIWPQEFYFVAGLLVMAGIGLFLVTSVIGRAWCGYFCPQTVWTDLFLHIERWIEGDRNAQIRLEKAPWTVAKYRKRITKHAIWLAIAVMTGGAWVFYFADAPTLLRELVTFDAPFVAYASIAVLTFTTYALGGLMREQVCIYMCPWPRIQGAMLDENSLTVTYNDWRGEPRGKHRKRAQRAEVQSDSAGPQTGYQPPVIPQPGMPLKAARSADTLPALGDCIDCNACVNVCPTGVDIREGQQIGCITCGLCIDACNDIMERVDLPKHLISYSTLADYEASKAGAPQQSVMSAILKPRTAIYAVIWGGIGLAMVAALLVRDRLDASFEHVRNPPFIRLADGSIRNGFDLKLSNMRLEPRMFEIALNGLPGAFMTRAGSDGPPSRDMRIQVPGNGTFEARVFVTLPEAGAADAFRFDVRDLSGTDAIVYDANFLAPE